MNTPTRTHGADAGKVGQVSIECYQQLVTRILQIDERHTRDQFEAGDAALEIEPIQQAGGAYPADELFSVEADMQRLFDDTRIPVGH